MGKPGNIYLHVVCAEDKKREEPDGEQVREREREFLSTEDITRAAGNGAWLMISEGQLTLSSLTAYKRGNNIPM